MVLEYFTWIQHHLQTGGYDGISKDSGVVNTSCCHHQQRLEHLTVSPKRACKSLSNNLQSWGNIWTCRAWNVISWMIFFPQLKAKGNLSHALLLPWTHWHSSRGWRKLPVKDRAALAANRTCLAKVSHQSQCSSLLHDSSPGRRVWEQGEGDRVGWDCSGCFLGAVPWDQLISSASDPVTTLPCLFLNASCPAKLSWSSALVKENSC